MAIGFTRVGGSGDDYLVGSAGDDSLYGGAGNDQMFGSGGNDQLFGEAGFDRLYGDDGDDLLVGGPGGDRSGDQLSGGAGNDRLFGADGNDVLFGGTGSDYLSGGRGGDYMDGGFGNDTYVVDDVLDRVIEIGDYDGGTDTVISSLSMTLAANVENLTLAATAGAIDGTGNALNNRLEGNGSANTLRGGDGNDKLFGMAGNDVLDGGNGLNDMQGGVGDDTYIVDDNGDRLTEAAGQGNDTVESSIGYALGVNVENLTLRGSADINATGNALDNILEGNAGNNLLFGGAGSDTMRGGHGDDTYVVDRAGDSIVELGGEGNDTVQSSISYTLGANFENLILDASPLAIDATGNALDNVLRGNAEANRLDGSVGADRMSGGGGDDAYVVDNSGDVVFEAAGEGVDTVESRVSFVLGDNVDNLVLAPTVESLDGTGNALDNILRGNAGSNVLSGGAGNDLLIGGAGADRLSGGVGDDQYEVDDSGDVVLESAAQGTDTVRASVGFVLADNVENLILDESAGASVGTGNRGDNTITGNSSANTLSGGDGNDLLDGNGGADILRGGLGDDTYVVDNAGDRVFEESGQGTDTVLASVTHTLGAQVENLRMTAGAGNIDGEGNEAANLLTGNEGDNRLDGGGGADVMGGQRGNDTYRVDDAGDRVVEGANEGIDTVESTLSYTLGDALENLVLAPSGLAIDGTGNGLNNSLHGNAGDNRLDGKAGADTMAGGAGDDTYAVDNAGDTVSELAGEGVDTVIMGAHISYTLSDNVENLRLASGGDQFTHSNGTGNALDNHIVGNVGANVLNGGAGADILEGGGGQDTYLIDNATDVIIDPGVAFRIVANISYTLPDNAFALDLSNADFSGIANFGLFSSNRGTDPLNGTGNELRNFMQGNDGNNVLDGRGGDDRMSGGGGDDTLIGGDGFDQMVGGADNDTLQGGEGADVMAGGDGNDILVGGAGADAMFGDGGDDLLIFDAADLASTNSFGRTDSWRGDAGTDTLRLVDAGATLDLTAVADDRVTGIETIDLTGSGDNRLVLAASDLTALSDTDLLRVDGNAGDAVTASGSGWTAGADQSVGDNLYHSFVNEGATLLVDVDVTMSFT